MSTTPHPQGNTALWNLLQAFMAVLAPRDTLTRLACSVLGLFLAAPCALGQCTINQDCNDGIPCTHDQCDNGACRNNPLDAFCDDGLFCNGAETCDPAQGDQAGCKPGTPPCIANSCAENTDSCFCDENADCDDGRFCNGLETCVNGACVLSTNPCDDGLACTYDICVESGYCFHYPDHSQCDDEQFCNGLERCDTGLGCLPGAPPDCGDAIPCTVDGCDEGTDACTHTPDDSLCTDGIDCTQDACDAATGCSHSADNSHCSDGIFCNGQERCDLLNGCVSGLAPCLVDIRPCMLTACDENANACTHTNLCIDGVGCTVDRCTFAGCIYLLDSDYCDDGLYCNGFEECDPTNGHPLSGCRPGSPPLCGDGVDCTADSCDEILNACVHDPQDSDCDDLLSCTQDVCDDQTGCDHIPNSPGCDDGVFCNGVEFCEPSSTGPGTGCAPGPLPECDDSIACTTDSCDSPGDLCVHTPVDAACDDDVICTLDVCNPNTGCEHIPTDSICDDGAFCNGVEYCDAQAGCRAGVSPCPPDSRACIAASCNEETDECLYTNTCGDGIACTTDVCTEWGSCRHLRFHAYCDDGIFCNGIERCDPLEGDPPSGCAPSYLPPCDDRIACTVDTCDEELGCAHFPVHTACNDGVDCTTDFCDPQSGCLNTPQDASCDDGNFCNGAEKCDAEHGCLDGSFPCTADLRPCIEPTCDETTDSCSYPHNCGDDQLCTLDSCTPEGVCAHTPDDTICDDGVFCNGAESCHQTLGCQNGPAPTCNDGIACTADSCDQQSDACLHVNTCDDYILCTIDECLPNGECSFSENHAVCDDGRDCTYDLCRVPSGGCVNYIDHAWCEDGLFCNGEESCDPLSGDPQTGCLAGSYPCGNQNCSETADSCLGCLTDAGCTGGLICCLGFCGECCTNSDCAEGLTCCPLSKTCRLVCVNDPDIE